MCIRDRVLVEGDRLEVLEFAADTTYRNSIPIPPGAVAGQTLTVAAPGQPVVKFVVPAGLEAGATVQVPVGTKETA